jgi:quercetin dioxygenase-like cupin family protein
MRLQPMLTGRDTVDRLAVAGSACSMLLRGNDSGGQLSIVEISAPPGAGAPMHEHSREDESFYILEGELIFTVAGRRIVAGSGDCVFGPRNIPHAWANESHQPARVLVVLTPAGFENYFDCVGKRLSAGEAPAPPSPAEVQALFEHAPAFGLRFLVD